MTNESDNPYKAFDPPDAATLVTFRSIGGTTYAKITTKSISSVEVNVISEALREAIVGAAEGSLRSLVLDMEPVTFINSEAIGMLLTTYSTTQSRDVRFILANVTESVAEVLATIRLTQTLTVCCTAAQLDDALAADA